MTTTIFVLILVCHFQLSKLLLILPNFILFLILITLFLTNSNLSLPLFSSGQLRNLLNYHIPCSDNWSCINSVQDSVSVFWTDRLQIELFHIFFIFFPFLKKIFKLYNIVLVLPNIEMNPPQAYMCSPSWTLLPPPSPYHPSGSSQCTSPKHPVSCIKPGPATHSIYDIIRISMPFSQIIPPSPSPTESKTIWF